MAPIRSEATHNTSDSCIEKTFYEDGVMVTRYFCPRCSGSVARKADFQRHMRQHTGRGLIYCKVPGCTHKEGFTQRCNLRTHHRAVHLRERHRCPHFWVDANGKQSECNHSYSDPSGLIRHRSLRHGFEAGDDEEKIEEATPVGMKFPNSKYARGTKRQADNGDDDLAKLPTHRSKRSKPTPAPSSSRRSPTKKSTPTNSAPTSEQQDDWSSLYTLPGAKSSEGSPLTVSDWDLGFGCPTNDQPYMQSQPAAGMSGAKDPLALPYTTPPIQPGNFDALFNSEPQTAVVNNWMFSPQVADFDFSFTSSALPLPACNGTIDPSMLMIPTPVVPPTLEQANLANAGLASSPGFYGPGQGMGWESYPSPGSSRESTASPDFNVFAGMPQWMPAPSEPLFNGYYGL